ncbi:hypothetical protein [Phyllobacterium sp. YR531]|uniref:hypothetical protein n=1 Tax=Phyllobacterium sp. YR531 TaxID=1144343 RepID=UPI001FCA4B47|nr:hypothetical protein [Phyllobacterium sp. YR531]
MNKPFYPLYVWWLVGDGYSTAILALLAVPFFFAIILTAKSNSFAARLALPVIGTFDTIFETAVFGKGSGTLLFFAPCIALAALSFCPHEKRYQQITVCIIFFLFAVVWWLGPTPSYPWTADQLNTLLNINVLAVAGLMALIGLRYAGIHRDGQNHIRE